MKNAVLIPGEQILLTFSYSLDLVKQIKEIVGRRYIPERKQWTVPYSLSTCFLLKSLGFVFDKELSTKANDDYIEQGKPLVVPGLKAKLFPYQEQGVKFLKSKKGRAIIADEMGLGKTLQALAWLQLHRKHLPAVVVCPASLKWNWAQEIDKWCTDIDYAVLNGVTPQPIGADVYIINYDILVKEMTKTDKGAKVKSGWCVWLQERGISTVILDEAHYIKNDSTQRTKATKYLCKGVKYVIPLTGTPIENKTSEIFNLVQLVEPRLFYNKWSFLMNYCRPINNGFGWSYDNEPRNLKEKEKWDKSTKQLFTHLQTVMIRRKKKDVLTELPDKMYSFIPIPLANEKEYDAAEADFIGYLADKIKLDLAVSLRQIEDLYGMEGLAEVDDLSIITQAADKANPLVRLEMLKQCAAKGILEDSLKWIEDFLESGEKLVVFTTHKFMIDAVMKKFPRISVKVDGSVKGKDRQTAVNMFQEQKKIKLFVGNIQAAGVGLTLTASSNVCFLEYPMVPGQLAQAVDRCHRIGQKNTVNVWLLGAKKPIIETIVQTLVKKQKTIDSVLEGKLSENSDILGDILQEITKKHT